MWLTAVYRAVCCVCLPALTLAWLEIEIEGSDGGWAKGLPTWRYTPTFLRWLVHHNRPFTGYHVTLGLTMASTSHCGLYLTTWSWHQELILLSGLLIMMGLEDHLWFCFNYGYREKEVVRLHVKHFDSTWQRYGTYVVLCALSVVLECCALWLQTKLSWSNLLSGWCVVLLTAVLFALFCEFVLKHLHQVVHSALAARTVLCKSKKSSLQPGRTLQPLPAPPDHYTNGI